MIRSSVLLFICVFFIGALSGCGDRKIEPFIPGEEPMQPDLSKIFPESADVAPAGMTAGNGAAPEVDEERLNITGRVSVLSDLEEKTGEGVLFIIARKEGMRPPLAVKRIENPSFPLTFSLGPADRMVKTVPFTGSLTLSVRLDGDGNVMSREPGDLQSMSTVDVDPGTQDVELVLDILL
jgi:hypothetical protein